MGLFSRTKNVDIFFVGCDGTDIDRGVYSFYLDSATGEIIKKSFVKSLAIPLSMSKSGRWMYLGYRNGSGRATDGGVWQYSCMDLQLGLAARVSYEGRTYIKTLIAPDRLHGYAIDYYNGEIVTMPIRYSKLVRVSEAIKLNGHSIDPIKQTESHPTDIVLAPDHKVIVLDMGGDQVLVYDIDERGYLKQDQEHSFNTEAGSGPRKILFSNSGQYAYIMNEINSHIDVYQYDSGQFTKIQSTLSYLLEECDGNNIPTDMVLLDDGSHLAIINKGDDTLVLFSILDDGTIKRIDCIETDEGPNNLMIFRDRWFVVTSKITGTIESFELRSNEKRGILFETHSRLPLHGPVCVAKGTENLRVTR